MNSHRNIPLAKLAPLRHPEIEFYSHQKGQPAGSELAELTAAGGMGPETHDHTRVLRDFSDTAALVR